MSPATLRVHRIAHQALGLAVVRLALGLGGFLASSAVGAERGPAATGLAFGAGASALALISDRRWVLSPLPTVDQLPDGAERVGPARAIASGLLPSTAGVTLLAIVALAFEPVLSAVLAGVLVGMALVTLMGVTDLLLREHNEARRYHADATDGSRRYVSRR